MNSLNYDKIKRRYYLGRFRLMLAGLVYIGLAYNFRIMVPSAFASGLPFILYSAGVFLITGILPLFISADRFIREALADDDNAHMDFQIRVTAFYERIFSQTWFIRLNDLNWYRLGCGIGAIISFSLMLIWIIFFVPVVPATSLFQRLFEFGVMIFLILSTVWFGWGAIRQSLPFKPVFFLLLFGLILSSAGYYSQPIYQLDRQFQALNWGFNIEEILLPGQRGQLWPASDTVRLRNDRTGTNKITENDRPFTMQTGDRIISVFGLRHTPENYPTICQKTMTWWSATSTGEAIPITIERQGQHVEVKLIASKLSGWDLLRQSDLWRQRVAFWLTAWLTALIFGLVGWLVVWKRPDDLAAVLIAIFCAAFAHLAIYLSFAFFSATYLSELSPHLRNLLSAAPLWSEVRYFYQLVAPHYGLVAVQLLITAMFFFQMYTVFPLRNPLTENRPIVFIIGYLLLLPLLISQALDWPRLFKVLPVLLWGGYIMSLTFSLASYTENPAVLRKLEESAKTQLRCVVNLGLNLPMLLCIIIVLSGLSLERLAGLDLPDGWIWLVIPPLACLLPIAIAIAIFKYRLLDIDLVFKKSVVLSTTSFILLMVFEQLNSFTTTYLANATVQQSGMPQLLMAIIITMLFNPVSKRIQIVVEKRFFPDRFLNQVTLQEIERRLRQVTDIKQISGLLMDRLMIDMRVSSACFFRLDPGQNQFLPVDFRHQQPTDLEKMTFDYQEPLIQRLIDTPRTTSYQLQDKLDDRLNVIGVRVCLPLFSQQRLSGLLFLGTKTSRDLYTREDMELLDNIADNASLALENVLLTHEMAEQAEWKHELSLAAQIQQELLPQQIPTMPQYDIDGYSQPARQVGGDLYDFFVVETSGGSTTDQQSSFNEGRRNAARCVQNLDEASIAPRKNNVGVCQKLGVVIGDVSGKSVPAAMVMAISQGIIEMIARHQSSPASIMTAVNQALCSRVGKNRFVALCYAEFDPTQNTLTYSLAGLPEIIMIRKGKAQLLALCEHRVPLGQIKDLEFDEKTVTLQPNDAIVFVSDGIDEATAVSGAMYEMDRLLIALDGLDPHLTANEIRNRIMADVLGFVQDAEQHDDMTVVVVKLR